jgi:hypothetical protein
MNKYLVSILFEWNEETMKIVAEHRAYVNTLIDDGVIEHYVVSMENQTIWVTINAASKIEVKKILAKSPFHKYWELNVHELIIWDGQNYRLPMVQLN